MKQSPNIARFVLYWWNYTISSLPVGIRGRINPQHYHCMS